MARFISCRATCETLERAVKVFGDSLPSTVINLGVSNAHESEAAYRAKGFRVVNSCEGCGNCVDKLKMFGLLERAGVSTLSYFNLTTPRGFTAALGALADGKRLVFRNYGEKPKVVGGIEKLHLIFKYTYATVFEEKVLEWRVLVYKGKAFKVMLKRGNDTIECSAWCLKQANSEFFATPDEFGRASDLAERAAVACGIDLCGIDVLLNKGNVFKVLEVNSGMGMCNRTLRKLKKLMEAELQ